MLVKQDQYVEKSYIYVEFPYLYPNYNIYIYISIDILDIYILPFGYKYYNLDIYLAISTLFYRKLTLVLINAT